MADKKLSTTEGEVEAKPEVVKKTRAKPKPEYERITVSNGLWGTQIDKRDLALWEKDGFKEKK
jgi:hypothetical protein